MSVGKPFQITCSSIFLQVSISRRFHGHSYSLDEDRAQESNFCLRRILVTREDSKYKYRSSSVWKFKLLGCQQNLTSKHVFLLS